MTASLVSVFKTGLDRLLTLATPAAYGRSGRRRTHNRLSVAMLVAMLPGRSKTAQLVGNVAKISGQTRLLYKFGQIQAASGDTSAAIATFRSVLLADPAYSPARIALATLLSAIGDNAAALVEIDQVVRQDPADFLARSVKGHIEAACGLLDAAIVSFRQMVAARPDDNDARIALASVLSEQGDRSAAIAELEAVLRRTPENVVALKTKAKIEVAMGRAADATRSFEQYVEQVPDDAEACLALADCYFSYAPNGFLKAEPPYRATLSRSPATFAAYRGLGECLARQKRLDEAQAAHDSWFQGWIGSSESADLRGRQDAARGRGAPAIMFVAMLKSASEFIRENLMRVLDLPEIYVNIGTVPRDRFVPSAVKRLSEGGAISRAHMSGNNLPGLAAHGLQQLILHVRDPRQVTVSWLHMMRRLSVEEFRYAAHMYDPPVPDDFAGWHWSQQLDWAVQNFLPGQLEWLESWVSALDNGSPVRVKVSRFEDFSRDQNLFFRDVLDFYGLAPADLPALAEQSAAAMRNFRQGQTDEWRAVLAPGHLEPLGPRLKALAERFGWQG